VNGFIQGMSQFNLFPDWESTGNDVADSPWDSIYKAFCRVGENIRTAIYAKRKQVNSQTEQKRRA
jgi:hypothetical protein